MTQSLAKKRIAVVGLGLSGLATVRFLLSLGIKPVLMDSRSKPAGIEHIATDKVDGIYLGELDANRLAKMDMIILSPGLSPTHPAIRFAVAQGAELLGDVELFARYNTKPVVAITGSNGKSTVTKLVEAMLLCSGVKALAAGNIGLPVLDAISQQDTEVFVLELSSFQLDTTRSLHSVASTILNVSADHLDRYQTMAAYAASKQRVYQHTQLAVFNLDDAATTPEGSASLGIKLADPAYGIAEHQGKRWLVLDAAPLLPVSDMTLFGAHNEFNALVAGTLALAAGASREGLIKALTTFEALPHRCTLVAEKHGVR
ncbi:MAG TPA: UDP-N-acetylmuramoyl-L-alanine--D-glutamate ligase, partial [Rheinheimera sp.]|uniref:UDP-N-acetylmuramoyl-L-alanine--D-glutamate ligase n=1 Tax=Rheinheimera sp. TaxID=1869214 RepID=UPI002F9448C7